LLESKKFDFRVKNDWLTIKNDDRSVLIAKRQNNVYSLRHFDARLTKNLKEQTIDKALVIKVDLDVWHQRVDHINFENLITLSQMTKKIEFVKSIKSQNDKKDHFCEICVLNKAHKMHNKTFVTHRVKISNERLHSDLFDDENTLSNVEEYRYEIIMMNDHTRMKFLLILKSKDEIILKIRALFNKMKTHTDR
jgi:hypothetical protein